MSTAFSLVYVFLSKYLVPLLFAIGLMYLLYGLIKYFIINEADHGRELFLKSIAWFVLALIIFALVTFFGWLSTIEFNPGNVTTPSGGVNLDERESILEVPNAPTR